MNQVELYNYIYSHALPEARGLYGRAGHRDRFFVKFIVENTTKGSVIDLGCGRGTLLRWLRAKGYKTFGTEIADWLLSPYGDLYGLLVKNLSYEQLDQLQDNTYDIVISNDVIEHIDSEDLVISSLSHMARISKKYVLVSTGGWRAAHCPFPKETEVQNLHTIVKPPEWWREVYCSQCDLQEEYFLAGSYFFFGEKK